MSNKFNPKSLEEVRKLIETQEPLPGMFDAVMQLTRQTFATEEKMCRMACERLGVPVPENLDPPGLTQLQKALAGSIVLVREMLHGGPADEQTVMQRSWVVDIRAGGEIDYKMTYPRTEMVREGLTFFARLVDGGGAYEEMHYRLNEQGELVK